MSVSAVAPTPFYQDPERLPIGLPQASSGDKADKTAQSDGKHLSMFGAGDDEPSFWDLLDVINPLQHIPVISNLYREMTGDQIGVGARLVGGTLFGGALGLIASAVDCVVEESTGTDTGGHMLALFRDEGQSSPGDAPATQLAQSRATPAADPAPAAAVNAVSSSPAKTAAAETAQVISLPDAQAAGASQPMVFSLDGQQNLPPIAQSPIATAKLATADQAGVTVTAAQGAGKPMPLLQGSSTKGFMPVPARAASGDIKPAPLVTVPVSNGSARSNVPITGRSPQASANLATAQRAQVSQAQLGQAQLGQDSLASHPMAPPTDATGQTAASPDWFSNAWGQALDKYQRANQRNGQGAGTSTTSTLQ